MRLNRSQSILTIVDSTTENLDNSSDASFEKWLVNNIFEIDNNYTTDDRVTKVVADETMLTDFNVTDVPITEKLTVVVSSLCYNHKIPSINEYLTGNLWNLILTIHFFLLHALIDFRFWFLRIAAINLIGVTIFTLGALAVLLILYMYVDTLRHITKHAPPLAKANSAFVISVYPVSETRDNFTFFSNVCTYW